MSDMTRRGLFGLAFGGAVAAVTTTVSTQPKPAVGQQWTTDVVQGADGAYYFPNGSVPVPPYTFRVEDCGFRRGDEPPLVYFVTERSGR